MVPAAVSGGLDPEQAAQTIVVARARSSGFISNKVLFYDSCGAK
jgi:hypothetical protein